MLRSAAERRVSKHARRWGIAGGLLLTACTLGIDPDQSRLCRTALPALEPGGVRIAIDRIAPEGSERLRITYRASRAEDPPLARFALCRFAPDPLAGNRPELVGITTDRGEVAGATLFLLKRYYAETPEGAAAAPGPGDRAASLAEIPGPLAYAAEQALSGLPRTAIYGLLASAYALVLGLVGRINLAFGEVAAVGAAAAGLTVVAVSGGGLNAPLGGVAAGLAVAVAAAALHGTVLGQVAFAAVPAGRAQASLIATVGLSLALSEYLRLAGGAVPSWIPPIGSEPLALARAGAFILTVTPVSLLTAAIGVAAAAATVVLLAGSRFGRAWRAACDDPLAAALCGIDGRGLLRRTLALSGALAGLAGALVAVQYGALGFAGGFQLGLKALAAAILGGIGSVTGALVGGLAIGAFETLWSAYLPIDGRDIALYAVLILAVVLRPDGLLGSPPAATEGTR